jgi:hypothetical protein
LAEKLCLLLRVERGMAASTGDALLACETGH